MLSGGFKTSFSIFSKRFFSKFGSFCASCGGTGTLPQKYPKWTEISLKSENSNQNLVKFLTCFVGALKCDHEPQNAVLGAFEFLKIFHAAKELS